MDAMLYMTTGMLDRHDEDIMLETAMAKVFCSELGWDVVNDAVVCMGGEACMVENGLERIHRDARIYTIVEGSNDVMHPFIFSYGSKDMGMQMMGVKEHPFKHIGFGMQLGAELFMGFKRPAPSITRVHPNLAAQADRLGTMIRDVSHWIRLMFKEHDEYLFERQTVQARISWALTWTHATACVLSKLDQTLRGETAGADLEYEMKVGTHFCNLAYQQFRQNIRGLRDNSDATLKDAAEAALGWIDTLPNSDFAIPESSPNAKGEGRELKQDGIRQFGAGSLFGQDNWEL